MGFVSPVLRPAICHGGPKLDWPYKDLARPLRLSPLPRLLPVSPGSTGWRESGRWDDTQEEAETC